MKYKFSKGKGFTIMEVLIVVFIVEMGLIGVLSLIIQNIQAQYVNRNTLIASQLAQEGIELVRNIRDNNWKNELSWKYGAGTGTNSDIIQDSAYSIDYLGILNTVDVDDPKAKLYIDGNGYYRHYENPGLATPSVFSRLINISNETDDSIGVSCLVQWKEKTKTKQYMADTILYNWR